MQGVAVPEFPIGADSRVGTDSRLSSENISVGRPIEISDIARARLGVNESLLLRVLVSARELLWRGWAPGHEVLQDERGTRFTIRWALKEVAQGHLVGVYALRHVEKALGRFLLDDWENDPRRTKAHVMELMDHAVVSAGGKPRRRGGWAVRQEVA